MQKVMAKHVAQYALQNDPSQDELQNTHVWKTLFKGTRSTSRKRSAAILLSASSNDQPLKLHQENMRVSCIKVWGLWVHEKMAATRVDLGF